MTLEYDGTTLEYDGVTLNGKIKGQAIIPKDCTVVSKSHYVVLKGSDAMFKGLTNKMQYDTGAISKSYTIIIHGKAASSTWGHPVV